MKNIAVLVSNPAVHDNRVIKQAETLSSAGYNVTAYCYGLGENETISSKNGVLYKRFPEIRSYKLFLMQILEARRKTNNFFLALPPRSFLIFVTYAVFALFFKIMQTVVCKGYKLANGMGLKLSDPSDTKAIKLFTHVNKILFRDLLVPAMHLLIFCSFYESLIEDKYDTIHAHDLDTALTGAYFAKQKGAKLIYDAHELETDRDDRSSKTAKKLSFLHEFKAAEVASAIITVSPKIAERIRSLYHLPYMPVTILNSPRTTGIDLSGAKQTLKDELGLSNQHFLSVYVGLLSTGRNLPTVIESAKNLPAHHHIALIGPASDKYISELEELIKTYGLNGRIHICKPVPQHVLLPYISSCDCGLILSDLLCDSFKYSMPNKLFEMSFSGIPMVVSNLESISEYVEENGIGITIRNELNAKNIAAAILELEEKHKDYKPSKQSTLDMMERYNWERQEEKLLKVYNTETP